MSIWFETIQIEVNPVFSLSLFSLFLGSNWTAICQINFLAIVNEQKIRIQWQLIVRKSVYFLLWQTLKYILQPKHSTPVNHRNWQQKKTSNIIPSHFLSYTPLKNRHKQPSLTQLSKEQAAWHRHTESHSQEDLGSFAISSLIHFLTCWTKKYCKNMHNGQMSNEGIIKTS